MKYKFKSIFSNRKTLYLVFSLLLVSMFTLTIAYAALNTVLKINGNAEVVASSWDIYLDNVQLVSGSTITNVPIITDKTTASFTTTLTNPGDYYMFTVDVVNNGSIDAMIDSIEKLPQLSEVQAKYLNYIVEYQNGESISTKQLVEANSFVRLKVKVEFRRDISSTDLPTQSEILNLSFKVNYVQADESGSEIVDGGFIKPKLVSGDYDTVGSEVCIDTECFYIISSTDSDVTLLAKYNLFVGGKYEYGIWSEYEDATGRQDSTMLGRVFSDVNGTIPFASGVYWSSIVSEYPTYIYNSNSNFYTLIENYKTYLQGLGINIKEARLIKNEEVEVLGCSASDKSCVLAPSWVYSTSYFTGSAYNEERLFGVSSDGLYFGGCVTCNDYFGVRPVITISKSEF